MSKDRWRDHYSDRAKRSGYLARSVFKLEEADRRFSLVSEGTRVLDLGCAPGSWMQYLSRRVGKHGLVVGVDLNEPGFFASNTKAITKDVFELDPAELAQFGPFDLVVSDMAPATTGISDVDAARSLKLADRAAEIACSVLKEGGSLFVKIFEGPETRRLRNRLKDSFASVRAFKPKASRKASREYYLVCLGFKGK